MAHEIEDGRNISTAGENWDSGLDFGQNTNLYKLITALLSEAERIDDDLNKVYNAQHINTATGKDLDKFGKLVQTPRLTGESDDKYRARIKASFRVGNIGTTTDQFIEFGSEILQTDSENITLDYPPNRATEPAQVNFIADSSVYNSVNLTNSEVVSLLEDAVPAGHEVNIIEEGTFILKGDNQTDDASKGLTGDNTTTGGTLAGDLV